MYVRDILTDKGSDVITVASTTTVREFVKTLVSHRIGAVIVTGADGSVVGVMSERDVIYSLADQGAESLDSQVEALMTRDVVTCGPDTLIESIMGMMTRRRIRHLPVIEDGKLIGIVSIGDIVKRRIAEAEREANELRSYITA